MGLLTIDITKVKRLSIKDVKPPLPIAPEPEIVVVEPTPEEIAFTAMAAINPLLEELVDRLSLVSSRTGEPLRKAKNAQKTETPPPMEKLPTGSRLKSIAQSTLKEETGYTKEEIVDRLQDGLKVSKDRAENGFKLLLESGEIETAGAELYYLKGSTPF